MTPEQRQVQALLDRVAWLERRLTERENTIATVLDRLYMERAACLKACGAHGPTTTRSSSS